MATDVDVQYFSHLNGLVLGNNWGDLIRLLDKALVTGIDFTQITAASIDAQGNVHITLFAVHNAMLFQVVELTGFTPNSLNQKYRIKGVPGTTKLILKPKDAITVTSISVIGNGKLAPLGYDIIFRDQNDVKRVYRAKNPTAQHPFIRVDESLTSPDGTTGVYTPTYSKYAMVGLLEHMDHIDDYQNPNVLQLPFDPTKPAKNWKITGKGTSVVRGWSRWYWAKGWDDTNDTNAGGAATRNFTLCGDGDAFYLLRAIDTSYLNNKILVGCGTYQSEDDVISPNWFLMTRLLSNTASTNYFINDLPDGNPLMRSESFGGFYATKALTANLLSAHTLAKGVVPDFASGCGKFNGNALSALSIPFYDDDACLRGNLKHVCYSGKLESITQTSPKVSSASMYVSDTAYTFTTSDTIGAFTFYLGEL